MEPLLDLFRASEVSSTVAPLDGVRLVWRQTLDHDGVTVFVSETKARIVATCMLITAPNLLRSGRGHAFLEMSLPTQRSEDRAMAVPWLRPHSLRPGHRVAIMSCFKAAERISGCIGSTCVVASNQGYAWLTSLAACCSLNDRSCEGFRCRPITAVRHALGPASESLVWGVFCQGGSCFFISIDFQFPCLTWATHWLAPTHRDRGAGARRSGQELGALAPPGEARSLTALSAAAHCCGGVTKSEGSPRVGGRVLVPHPCIRWVQRPIMMQ